jgi:hypothetical protein
MTKSACAAPPHQTTRCTPLLIVTDRHTRSLVGVQLVATTYPCLHPLVQLLHPVALRPAVKEPARHCEHAVPPACLR